MNNKSKSIILSTLLSSVLLAGCSDKEIVEIDGKNYIKSGEEYIEVMEKKQIFEPGTHFIQYYNFVGARDGYYRYEKKSGFVDNSNVPAIDGYEVYSIEPVLSDGYTYGYMYIFVNTLKVEATANYDYENNVYNYSNPGVVVEEHKLS